MRTRLLLLFVLAGCRGNGAPVDAGLDGSSVVTLDAGRDPGDGARSMPDSGAPGTCESPGALEEVACGRCGVQRRFCTTQRVWELGPCTNEQGMCTPGEERGGPCGNCGTQREVCTASCEWEALGTCESAGVCAPGTVDRSRQGCDRGSREIRCSDACVFEPAGECRVDPCTTPGAIETVSCGNCGRARRFCSNAAEWEYGPCEGQGVCAPGTRQQNTCGLCGQRELLCTTACTWEPGACMGEGTCAPGTPGRTSDGCTGGATRPTTCGAACLPEPAGACEVPSTGALGTRCDDGRCAAGLVCNSAGGVPICREPCTGLLDGCERGRCVDFTYCTDVCDGWTDAGCPSGSRCSLRTVGSEIAGLCIAVGAGTVGSECTSHEQCGRQLACRLRGASRRCERVCDSAHGCPSGELCRLWSPDGTVGSCVRPTAPARGLVINEVDYDQPGDDVLEFIELYNGSTVTVDLGQLELVLVNGAPGQAPTEYRAIPLSGFVGPGGFVIVGPSGVSAPPGTIRVEVAAANIIQNGSNDGIALIEIATGRLLDAVAYDVPFESEETGRLEQVVLRGQTYDLIEGSPFLGDDIAAATIARLPNGADGNDAALDWAVVANATPGRAN